MPAHLTRGSVPSCRPAPRIGRASIYIAAALVILSGWTPARASQKPQTTSTPPPIESIETVPGHSVIWEAARGSFVPQPPDGPAFVRIGAGYELDPRAGDPEAALPPELRATPPTGEERGYFLILFRGPVTLQDRELIESEGGRIYSYIPDYTFLVSLPGDAPSRLAASPRVAWTGLYHPAYKLSTQPQMREPGRREVVILLFPDQSVEAAAGEIAAAQAIIKETSDNGINKILRAEIDTNDLAALARIPGIAWIEPFQRPQFYNDQCQWVVQTWQLNNRRIWNMGIRGEDQVISLADSGIRTTHKQFYDAAVSISDFGDYPTHRKIIAYKRSVDVVQVTFGDESSNTYHGTHTSCTAAGDDAPNGTDARDGMALHAKIYFLDGGSAFAQGIYVPLDLNDLMIVPYNGNAGGSARIMTNSWGTDNGGVYDVQSMTSDQFMWNHPDFLAFFSNGNARYPNTVGSPATAKNCVSAGGTGDGSVANQIYIDTSRGPTDDDRYKPTICAPAVLSSALGSGDTGYTTLAGTSMASPAMAGATVLIRQYLTEGWYPTGAKVPGNAIADPSAALMKAMAINSADPDVGSYTVPDNNIGWGRIDIDNALHFAGDTRRLALVDNTDALLTGDYVEYKVYVASSVIPLKATLVWTDYPGNPNAAVELVNDLNLTASNGADTYKGNVYSGGQSQTGGTYDGRNVEENVRRNSPAVGVWTFRIDGANVPFGPQPFALVVTGALASDQGIIILDKATYGGDDVLGIRVVDTNAGGNLTVSVTSTTEPSTETVTLHGANGIYEGSLPLRTTYPISANGELSVSDGDVITATYQDPDPVTILTAIARVDLTAPVITNVRATTINEVDATIAWTTSSAASSKVYYGVTPSLGDETNLSSILIYDHAVLIDNLSPGQTYFYDVESVDNSGNPSRDDNGGSHYTFSTDPNRDVLLVIGDETFDKKDRYLNAFARTGWTHTIWEGNQAAIPLVGNKTAGLASYKGVIWQTGLEQYPMFTDAARDSIAYLASLGSRLAVYSHDVAWDFCSTGSPDYSLPRCQWLQDQLKATWQADPTTFSLALGYAGDPISGDYTAGISYTPHRDGGAGDEVNGIAGDGSFAYVWKDNDATPDDIALRWTGNNPVGDPARSVWGGTRNKISSNFFEWAHLNSTAVDDSVRAVVLDKTLIWMIGRDHPNVDLTGPVGGEVFAGPTVTITWSESGDAGAAIGSRKIFYSDNSGNRWTQITDAAGPDSCTWDISAIPNGIQYRIRIVVGDDGSPVLSGVDASAADFTINRPDGDTRGPVVVAGSIVVDPNPILVPDPLTLTATISDINTGNSNIMAAEWSTGASPAPPGNGTAMGGLFGSPTAAVTASIDSQTLSAGSETFWVRGRDAAGQWGNASSLTVVVNRASSVAENMIPKRFALYGNAPNPFNPLTIIRFDLPRATAARLEIHDVTGRLLRTLIDRKLEPGTRSVVWDGRDDTGHMVGSGVYFYKLEAADYRATRKMTLLK